MKTAILAITFIVCLSACAPRPPQDRSGIDKAGADVAAFMATKSLVNAGYAPAEDVSMEPTFYEGDIVLYLQRPYASIREGQIIVRREGDKYIAHRAVRNTAEGWVTKGDNRRHNDANLTTPDNYAGVVFGVIWQ